MRWLTWKPIYCVLAVLLLSGCVGQAIRATKAGIQTDTEFNELVLADVRQAIILAETGGDQLALKCWTYLEAFTVENAPDVENPAGKIVGVFSAYQQARNVRRNVIEVKISDQFRLECGPMLIDSMGALGRIGVRIAF